MAEGVNIPQLQVFELPFMFESEAEVDFVMDSMFDSMSAKLEAKGLKMAFWHVNGWHNFATKSPIGSAQSLAGMKLRSQESPVHLAMFRALGAQPQTIPVPEVLSALQTGMVDGFSNTPLFTAATGWYEGGITDFTITHHIYQPAVILYSKKYLDKMPPDLRKIVIGNSAAEAAKGRKSVRGMRGDLLDFLSSSEYLLTFMRDSTRQGQVLLESLDQALGHRALQEIEDSLEEERDLLADARERRAALERAIAFDNLLEEQLEFAYSDELGYLTTCPTNVGTGLRLSVLIHLPGLVLNQETEKILNSMRQLQFAVRGLFGEGSAVRGALFQVSNLVTLGRSEEVLTGDFKRHVGKVIQYEKLAREQLYEKDAVGVLDMAQRSLAVLRNAHLITAQETFDRLSHVRMGVAMGIVPAIPMANLNLALVKQRAGHLQLAAGGSLRGRERTAARASYLRTLLA